MAKKTECRSACPISRSLEIWGDKWSLLILRDLMLNKKNTYGDFLKSDEKIATNILASRLVHLESEGLILKLEHPDSKVKGFYKLTQKGIDMLPILMEIYTWSEKYFDLPAVVAQTIPKGKEQKAIFIKTLAQELKKVKPL